MIYMYTNIVVFELLMFHAKFLRNWSTGSGVEDLGHVTLIIYIHIDSPVLYMLHMKFGFDWPSVFRGEDV